MVNRWVKRSGVCTLVISLIMSMMMSVSAPAPAYAQSASGADAKTTRSMSGPRRQLATIIFAGLGGAILGLSTLSFYGRPQDKLSNIAIGFAVGVIAGTSYVTYKAATNPQDFYGDRPWIEGDAIASNRFAMMRGAQQAPPITLGLNFEF